MDTSNHFSMKALFDQLGLPSEQDQIRNFIHAHTLKSQQSIENADFWSKSQASFLHEALLEDSDWTELVDHLSTSLHHK